MRLRKVARVILVGAPGVGKGTQSERLLHRFPQLSSISSGDLLRHQIKERTALGIKVETTIRSGGLVPDDLMLRLITNELKTRGWLAADRRNVMTLASSPLAPTADAFDASEADVQAFLSTPQLARSRSSPPPQASDEPAASFLLDGFPRTALQADRLDAIVPINLVVSIKTPFSVLMERISGRWVHEPSGRVYNTTFNKPKAEGRDDVTGEPLTRRDDDTEDVWVERFKKFEQTSQPLLGHYADKGVLWEVEGMSSDEISPKLYREFERRFC